MSGFQEAGKSVINAVFERIGRGMGHVQERKPLPSDLLESDDAYLAVFDAPGVTKNDIQVRFQDHTLEVRLDRFRDFHEGFEMRYPGRGLALSGKLELPDDASVTDTDASASATLTRSGTLQIEIPKRADARPLEVTDEEESAADDDSVDID
ncbi:Hsp20/alpha crystallin family protein [Haloferacaceae archaeon DSL9]